MKGLYIHIPFCKNICAYCDFYKQVYNKEKIDNYVLALVAYLKKVPRDYETIYIGGGTPSCIGNDNLRKLFSQLKTDVKEFSIECNVSDITEDLLKLFMEFKVSRVSLGVQTFNSRLIKVINRQHTKKMALTKIALLKKYPFILNIDMMFSLPTQTMKELSDDLEVLKSIDVDSISYYSLILEKKTVFYHEYLKGNLKMNSNEKEAAMYSYVIDRLSDFGYYQYENSNFTKKYESLHNKIYWLDYDYYGVGVSAVEKINNTRSTNIKNIAKYIELVKAGKSPFIEVEKIALSDQYFEYIMMGLRLNEGVSQKRFYELFQKELLQVFVSLEDLVAKEMIIINDDRIKLTRKGLFFQNDVLVELLGDLD